MDPDFEELSNDVSLIQRMKQFSKAIDDIERMIDLVADPNIYDSLTNADKIKYNLMMSFALNSTFWMHLRADGVDPMNHAMKNENNRLKQAMSRAQEIRDRQTIMPRLDKDVANRFIRNGLWTPNENCEENNSDDPDEIDKWDVHAAEKSIATDV